MPLLTRKHTRLTPSPVTLKVSPATDTSGPQVPGVTHGALALPQPPNMDGVSPQVGCSTGEVGLDPIVESEPGNGVDPSLSSEKPPSKDGPTAPRVQVAS